MSTITDTTLAEILRHAQDLFAAARTEALATFVDPTENLAAATAVDAVIGGKSARSEFLRRIEQQAASLLRMGLEFRPCHLRELAVEAKLAVLECIVTDQKARRSLAR